MKSNTLWGGIVLILLVVIAVLLWILFRSSDVVPPLTATSTVSQITHTNTVASTTLSAPLSKSVTVATPAAGATVSKTFTVAGTAPGGWYSEAVFPIQVRDQDNMLIGEGQAQAQGEWMTTAQVAFVATTTVTTNYTGPAMLVLLRDNPSGLPENDDSVSIPIVIK